MRGLALAALALLLSGCAVLNQTDIPATLSAQNAAFEHEIATLDAQGTAESADAQARAMELATSAAFNSGINLQLVGTLSAVVTPTPALESSAFENAQLGDPDEVGQRLFVNTGTSTQVNGAGCAVDVREVFSPYTPRIYATWVAYNLRAGTLFRVEWWYTTNQTLQFSDSWTATSNSSEICFWFYITPDDVTLYPGSWQARLFVDEVQMTAPLRFTIEGG